MVKPFRKTTLVGDLIGSIIGTAFASLFLIIGLTLSIFGYINQRDIKTFKTLPVTSIADLKTGTAVKVKLNPFAAELVNSSHSKTPCVFYKLDHLEYVRDEGQVYSRIKDTENSSDDLLLISNDQQILVPLEDPEPVMFLSSSKNYLKNRKTKKYIQTDQQEFSGGDKVIQEKILLPSDIVTVFGYLSEIVDLPDKNTKLLKFHKVEFKDPFSDIRSFYSHLFETLFQNKLTLYLVSTLSDEEAASKMSEKSGNPLIIFGIVFCIIPLLLIISMWLPFIRSMLGLRN